MTTIKEIGIYLPVLLVLFHLASCDTVATNADHIERVDEIREMASRKIDKGETTEALAFFDSAYQTIDNPGIGDEIRKYIFKGHNYFPKIGENEKALIHLDSIFYLLATDELKVKYRDEYYGALFQKGDILFKLKRYKNAYQYFYRGKIMTKGDGDACAISDYSYRLGMVSYKQEKYTEAVTHFKECFKYAPACYNDFVGFALQQEQLSNIALSYAKNGNIDSSIIFSNKGLAFLKTEGKAYPDRKDYIKMATAVIYGNQAQQYLKKGDTLTAERLLLKSIDTNIQKGFDINDAQLSLVKLGELYLSQQKYSSVQKVSEQLESSLELNFNIYPKLGLSKLNSQYYSHIEQPLKAFHALQEYIQIKDSLDRDNDILVLADIDKEFQGIEQQYQFELLSKDVKLKKWYLLTSLLFTLLVTAFLILIWKYWKTSSQNVAKLTNLNKEITFQNNQMEQALKDFEESNKDKDRILKVVAHDLRNPIGAILSIAGLILEDDRYPKEIRDLISMIKVSSTQSINMINDLLKPNFNFELANMSKEPFDMGQLVHECTDQLKFKADIKAQQIKIDVESDVIVMANKEKLWRVLSNLLVNSIKFSNPNSTIKVSLIKKQQHMLLAIKDYGMGVPDALKENIFDAFSETKRNGTAGEPSYGLGLSISKQIVEAHHGKIWFESQENVGTTFYIELPIVVQETAIPEYSKRVNS